MEIENSVFFWQKLDTLLLSSEIVIERPKNSAHPEYPNLIYPLDYGYFTDTVSGDAESLDLFRGSTNTRNVNAIIIAVDILKKDVETKILLGCTSEEEMIVLRFLNQTDFQKTVLIRRGEQTPAWAASEN